jgi:hypothetical protein
LGFKQTGAQLAEGETLMPVAGFLTEGDSDQDSLLVDGSSVISVQGTLSSGAYQRGAVVHIDPGTGEITSGATAPNGIVGEDADATFGAVSCLVYTTGKMKSNAILWPSGASIPVLTDQLRDVGIVIETTLKDTRAADTSQTPWTSDIDAANHALNYVSTIRWSDGANFPGGTNFFGQCFSGRWQLAASGFTLMEVDWTGGGGISFAMNAHFFGNQTSRPGAGPYAVVVQGDVNITGQYFVNGAPISGGGGGGSQTPWTGDVDAAGFALNSASAVRIQPSGALSTGNVTFPDKNGTVPYEWVLIHQDGDLVSLRTNDWSVGILMSGEQSYVRMVWSLSLGENPPAHKLDVDGDCNVTGAYMVGGVPMALARFDEATNEIVIEGKRANGRLVQSRLKVMEV